MQRLVSWLSALLVVTLAALQCGAPATTPAPTEAPAAAEPTPTAEPARPTGKITYLTPPWAVTNEDQLKAWSEDTGITVETITIPNEQVYERVQLALASGTKPADVIFLSEEAQSFIVTAGALAPLDGFVQRDAGELKIDEFPRLDFWKRDGKQLGITAYLQFPMLDYNADKLERAGFSEIPSDWTWDDFMEMATAVKEKGVEEFPVSFSGISWSWYLIALPMGDPLFDENLDPTFNQADSPGRRAMKLLFEIYDKELVTPDQVTQRHPHSLFAGGVGTLHQSWLGAHAFFNNPDASKQAPHTRYALLPEQHWTWAFDSAVGISKDSDNKEAAWEFVKFLLGPENQQHLFDAFGLVPARKSVLDKINAEGKNLQPEVQEEQGKFVRQLPRDVLWWGEWDSFVTETIRRVIQGQLTLDQGIDQIAAKWEEIRED